MVRCDLAMPCKHANLGSCIEHSYRIHVTLELIRTRMLVRRFSILFVQEADIELDVTWLLTAT
jgi:hypothetical protein